MEENIIKKNEILKKDERNSSLFSVDNNSDIYSKNEDENKKKNRINTDRYKIENPLSESEIEPIWVSVSEAAKFGGIQGKTIRRAIQANLINYKVINDRYQIDFGSVIKYLYTSTKLKNKLLNEGVGKYIDKWKK